MSDWVRLGVRDCVLVRVWDCVWVGDCVPDCENVPSCDLVWLEVTVCEPVCVGVGVGDAVKDCVMLCVSVGDWVELGVPVELALRVWVWV